MDVSYALLKALSTTGIPPDELARRLAVDPVIIQQFCRGSRNTTEQQVRQLAQALGCTVSITVEFLEKEALLESKGSKPLVIR
jgi:plasmid maintenance system antidote protein VapI